MRSYCTLAKIMVLYDESTQCFSWNSVWDGFCQVVDGVVPEVESSRSNGSENTGGWACGFDSSGRRGIRRGGKRSGGVFGLGPMGLFCLEEGLGVQDVVLCGAGGLGGQQFLGVGGSGGGGGRKGSCSGFGAAVGTSQVRTATRKSLGMGGGDGCTGGCSLVLCDIRYPATTQLANNTENIFGPVLLPKYLSGVNSCGKVLLAYAGIMRVTVPFRTTIREIDISGYPFGVDYTYTKTKSLDVTDSIPRASVDLEFSPGPGCLALLCCSRSANNSACMCSCVWCAGDGSRVHTHDHDGFEAPDESPDSILSSEPRDSREA
ncbi:hypothetical protein Tco_0190841 [Tanacetum coccineum]